MGAVWLAAGLLLLVFGRSTVLGSSSNFLPVVAILIILGAAFLILSLIQGPRAVLAASIDRQGFALSMSRPPDWSMSWGEPGSWIDLSRGYKKGSPAEFESPGWVLAAPGFGTSIDFHLGRALAAKAADRGWRVAEHRSGAAEGKLEFEFISLDHPLNPERHKTPVFGRTGQKT